MEFIQKHKFTILRILIGFVFILSALLKLSPIAPFENLLLKLDITDWQLAPYFARAIIGFEIVLGFLLISNIYIIKTLRIALYTLIGFSLFLLYLHFFVSTQDNCGCFGEIIELNPMESIIKNILLIIVILYLIHTKNYLPSNIFAKYQIYIACGIIVGSFALPFLFNTPILPGEEGNYVIKPGMKISDESIQNVIFNTHDTVNLTKNKHVICFASLTCKTCKYAISKLESIHKKNGQLAISIIFLDAPNRDELLIQVKKETGLQTIPYSFLAPKDFFKTSHNKLPFIMFVDNGEIKNLRNYSDLYVGDMFTFFEQD